MPSGSMSKAALSSLKGEVAQCVIMAKSPKGVMRCFEFNKGSGRMSDKARAAAGVRSVAGKRKAAHVARYTYSTKAYRAGKSTWASVAKRGGRKTPKRGKGGRFVKRGK